MGVGVGEGGGGEDEEVGVEERNEGVDFLCGCHVAKGNSDS